MVDLPSAMTSVFGPNWKPRLTGVVTFLIGLVYENPQVLHGVPEPWQGIIWKVLGYAVATGIVTIPFMVKSPNVTGGTVPATPEAAARVTEDNKNAAVAASQFPPTPPDQVISKSTPIAGPKL